MSQHKLGRFLFCSMTGIMLCGGMANAGWKSWWTGEEEQFPGSTQKQRYDRQWPPYSRPQGKEAKLVHQYHYAYYWPHPHTCEDRETVRGPIMQQNMNGWMTETTLYEHHFDPYTQTLNSAGRSHLKWILFETPVEYRTAFIAPADNAEATQTRLTHVQTVASEMTAQAGCGTPPIIVRSYARPVLTPAQDIDLLRRSWLATMPVPRIQSSADSATGATPQGSSIAK
ncbi:MAG: hypothetical protein U0903_02120 [Planctomycetales bacterium]